MSASLRSFTACAIVLLVVGSPAAGLINTGAPQTFSDGASASSEDPGVWLEPTLQQVLDERPREPRVIVLGLDHVPGTAVRDHLSASGLPWMAFEHLPVAAVVATADHLGDLLATPGLLSLATNEPTELLALPEGRSSNLGGTGDELLRADRARALGYDGSGVGIAIVDSGINGDHPELGWSGDGGPLVQNIEFVIGEGGGLNTVDQKMPTSVIVENQTDTDEVGGHGSHVAGTAAGAFTSDGLFSGRAPGADLIGVAITPTIAMLWHLAGFDWIIEHKETYNIRIVSNSWGSEGPYSPYHPVNLATKEMDEAGLLVLFAAGNAGPDARSLYKYGQAPWVIGVGATHLDGAVSSFSSRGDPKQGSGPDVVAPGHNIIAPRNKAVNTLDTGGNTRYLDAAFIPFEHLETYRVLSGTSMATPQVAGVAALLFEARPDLTPAEARQILYDTARPIYGHGYDAAGHGLVDAEAALRAALGLPYTTDWVEPTESTWDGNTRVYDYHGALVGAPGGLRPFYQDLHIPVRLPAEGMEVTFTWEPVAEVPERTTYGFLFRLLTPDGRSIHETSFAETGQPGTHTVTLDQARLEQFTLEGWSAAHWKAEVHLQAGAMAFDVEARVTYATPTLPEVMHEPDPIVPPPPTTRIHHAPIAIATNADLTAANGVVGGSGTPDDPYVIEGWEIGGNDDYALRIGGVEGVDAHVLLRNLRIHSGTSQCLVLENAHNLHFDNVLVEDCYWSFYIGGGTSDVTIENSIIQHGKYGLAIYGAHDLVVRNTTIYNHQQSGVVLSQGAAGGGTRYPAVNALLFEENTIRDGVFSLLTPAVFDVTLRDNTFAGSGRINFGTGSSGNTISGTHWEGGMPRYGHEVLGTAVPAWPAATIIDAGRDRTITAGQEVCFDPTIVVLQPRAIEEVTWEYGDGSGSFGENAPCHVYDPAGAPYTAEVTVTTRTVTGEIEVFKDTVRVDGA